LQPHRDALAQRRRQVLADVVRSNRQLTVPAIDEDASCTRSGRPKSKSASIAARIVRPVYRTSSTRITVRPFISNGRFVSLTTGAGPSGTGAEAPRADTSSR